LEELFEIVGTKSLDRNAINFTKEGFNFIGRTFENNGIQGKITRQEFEPNKPFTITATVIGQYKYVKFQKEPYYCSQNINKLTAKPIIKKWNEKIAYYLISGIQKFVSVYDGQQDGYKLEDIKKHRVQLPITPQGDIDFVFMEIFIAELEAYLLATGLNDYILTEEEQQALAYFEEYEWGEFRLRELFEISRGNISNQKALISDTSGIYFIAQNNNNNGFVDIVKPQNYKQFKGRSLIIGRQTSVVYYQDKDFITTDGVLVLIDKNKFIKNRNIGLFLASVINKHMLPFGYNNTVSTEKLNKIKITLPITSGNKIDFHFMETFISAIQKLVIKDVVLYAKRKMEATKLVISG